MVLGMGRNLQQNQADGKEAERKMSMNRKAEIITKKVIEMEEYWVIRGIRTNSHGGKEVVKEAEFDHLPTLDDIAQFLANNSNADFCSVAHNYKIR